MDQKLPFWPPGVQFSLFDINYIWPFSTISIFAAALLFLRLGMNFKLILNNVFLITDIETDVIVCSSHASCNTCYVILLP